MTQPTEPGFYAARVIRAPSRKWVVAEVFKKEFTDGLIACFPGVGRSWDMYELEWGPRVALPPDDPPLTERPGSEMTLGDWLDVVMEEAAEVAKAASKCKRFGFGRDMIGYGVNSLALAAELGDLLGAVDQLPHGH